MKEIKFEFSLKTSPSVLFNRLSSASGLAEWFADNVKVEGKVFTFVWSKSEQKAQLINVVQNEVIFFRWLSDENPYEFGFEIIQGELTNDISLIVTDHIEEDEDPKDAQFLWSSQIAKLKQIIGSA